MDPGSANGRANARPMTSSAALHAAPRPGHARVRRLKPLCPARGFQYAAACRFRSLMSLEYWSGPHARATMVGICVRVLAAPIARGLQEPCPPWIRRAQGKPGARCTRGLVCKCTSKCAHEHTGSAEAIRLSLHDSFTVSFALSLVTGLSCHHRHADRSTRLDASVGASGPHDFAVRTPRRSSKAHLRPPHPTARFVTTASAPLVG
jgi:hypothetical protein